MFGHTINAAVNMSELATPPPLDIQAHALFIDLDGTLFDIVERPEEVVADAEARALLKGLARAMDGALAVVSGRKVCDVERIFKGAGRFCIAGLHGQEFRLRDGARRSLPVTANVRSAAIRALALEKDAILPMRVEDKGNAVALHFRHAPEHASLIRRAADEIALKNGLRALHGKMVAELVPHGLTKGVAIEVLMHEPAFAGRTPIALGDDVTDEDAFDAAREWGGKGIYVGRPVATLADFSLADVAAVRAWLRSALDAA